MDRDNIEGIFLTFSLEESMLKINDNKNCEQSSYRKNYIAWVF